MSGNLVYYNVEGNTTNVEQAISKLDDGTPCYKSFRNISRKDFKVVEHIQDVSFYDIIS